MRAVFEHYDVNRPDYILPQACNPSYINDEFKRPLCFDQHMWNTLADISSTEWREDHLHPFPNIPLVHISDIESNETYLYIVTIYNVLFFQENRMQGMSCISDRILADINIGRCKLYFCMAWEGTSGERGSGTYDDFAILQDWCERERLNTNNIHYLTPNLIARTTAKKYGATYHVISCPSQEVWTWHSTLEAKLNKIPRFEPVDNCNLFLTYNRRPRDHRILLLAELRKREVFHRGIASFNPFDKVPQHEISKIRKNYGAQGYENLIYDLLSGGEIIADRNTLDITNSVGDSLNYRRTFCSIVTETLAREDTIFFSEKSWRCLSVGHPFLLLSSPGALSEMKRMGFKTFSNFWDESYDDETDTLCRIQKIVETISQLSSLKSNELIDLSNKIRPVLEYNKKHFGDRVHKRFHRENNKSNNLHVFTPIEEIMLGNLSE